MKIFILGFALILFNTEIYAQSEAFLRLFDKNKTFYNPAFTLENNNINFSLLSNYYYHSPKASKNNVFAYGANFSMPIFTNKKHQIGLGAIISNQSNSFEYNFGNVQTRTIRINLSYNYISKIGRFSLGTYAEMFHYNGKLQNDPYDIYNNTIPNTGLGFGYKTLNENFYFGFSAMSLKKYSIANQFVPYNFIIDRTYNFQSGYSIKAHKNLKIQPSILIEYSILTVPHAVLLFEYKNKFILGFSYHDATPYAGIRLGYKTKGISVNYAYNTYLGHLNKVYSGIHTLGLFYTIQK